MKGKKLDKIIIKEFTDKFLKPYHYKYDKNYWSGYDISEILKKSNKKEFQTKITPKAIDLEGHLKYIGSLLKKNKIKYWAAFKTLLGAVRDGQLTGDPDIFEIGIFEENRDKLTSLNLIENYNLVVVDKEVHFNNQNMKIALLVGVTFKNSLIGSIYLFTRMEDGYTRIADKSTKSVFFENSIVPTDVFNKLKHVKLGGITIPIPEFSKCILEHLYGNAWMIPEQLLNDKEKQSNIDYSTLQARTDPTKLNNCIFTKAKKNRKEQLNFGEIDKNLKYLGFINPEIVKEFLKGQMK